MKNGVSHFKDSKFSGQLETGSDCTCGRKSTVLRQNSSVARYKSHVLKPVSFF